MQSSIAGPWKIDAKSDGYRARGISAGGSALTMLSLILILSTQAGAALGERFDDSRNGYSIRPPAGWVARSEPAEGVSVAFFGPATAGFSANLNVVIVPESIKITPQFIEGVARTLEGKVAAAAARGGKGEDGAASSGSTRQNFQVTRRRLTKIGKTDAAYLESAYDVNEAGRFRQFQVIVPADSVYYTITYTAREESFEDYLNDVQASVNSFRPGAAGVDEFPPRNRWPWGAGLALVGGILIGLALIRAGRRKTGDPGARKTSREGR